MRSCLRKRPREVCETAVLQLFSWPFEDFCDRSQAQVSEKAELLITLRAQRKEKATTNMFNATSTTEDVLSGVNLKGKRILVTGVSAGLGVETARSLAAHGADVVGAARDLVKAEVATAQVRKDAKAGGGSFELWLWTLRVSKAYVPAPTLC
jgi:hypothetical protein